ncbi:MAG: FkbM family methyltransferase, partial [Bacteroidia bacterium]|nr:FkbM family methyltransferase [Bacteroidia bacterium]
CVTSDRLFLQQLQVRVLLIPVAIGGKNGTAGFTYLPDAPECSFLNPEQGGRIQVRTITFDALLSEIGWEEVDVAKVDCEGCEYELFSMLLTRHSLKSGCG